MEIKRRQLVHNDTDWYVPVAGMAVADCSQLVTVKVYNAEGVEVANAQDSISSYIARKSGSDPLYEALMKFSVSAYASFH